MRDHCVVWKPRPGCFCSHMDRSVQTPEVQRSLAIVAEIMYQIEWDDLAVAMIRAIETGRFGYHLARRLTPTLRVESFDYLADALSRARPPSANSGESMFVRTNDHRPVRRRILALLVLTLFLASTAQASVPKAVEAGGAAAAEAGAANANWPQWRGPLANGMAPHADPPTTWAEDKNVRWKVKLPGQGSST